MCVCSPVKIGLALCASKGQVKVKEWRFYFHFNVCKLVWRTCVRLNPQTHVDIKIRCCCVRKCVEIRKSSNSSNCISCVYDTLWKLPLLCLWMTRINVSDHGMPKDLNLCHLIIESVIKLGFTLSCFQQWQWHNSLALSTCMYRCPGLSARCQIKRKWINVCAWLLL